MPTAGSPANPDATRERILRAAVDWAARTGLRKLSMEEIAGNARIARATLYLHFPGRQALIDAAVEHEIQRLFEHLRTVVAQYANDPEERLVHTFAAAYRWLRENPMLQAVLKINPQVLMPYVMGDAPAIATGRAFVLEHLRPDELSGSVTAEEFADHVTRAFHTLILAPPDILALDSPGAAEDYARRFLLPLT